MFAAMTTDLPLKIYRKHAAVGVLGPGQRAVIWLHGCPRGCEGCILPEACEPETAIKVLVTEVADWVLAQDGIEGVTFSGGEPMLQSRAVVTLVKLLREQNRQLSYVLYTGYTFEELEEENHAWRRVLLENIDLLIDGPYLREHHGSYLWRASANQRLIPLSPRYRGLVQGLTPETDVGAGLEMSASGDGFGFIGIPPEPEFRDKLSEKLAGHGLQEKPTGED